MRLYRRGSSTISLFLVGEDMWSEVQIMSLKGTATEEHFVKSWKGGIKEKDWDDDPDEIAIPLKKSRRGSRWSQRRDLALTHFISSAQDLSPMGKEKKILPRVVGYGGLGSNSSMWLIIMFFNFFTTPSIIQGKIFAWSVFKSSILFHHFIIFHIV